MIEPRRLLDEVDGLDRSVLESARDDDPSPERRARVLAAFGGTSLSLLASAGAARRAAAWKIGFWKVVVGVAATAGIGIGAAALNDGPAPSSNAATSAAPRSSVAAVVTAAPTAVAPAASSVDIAKGASGEGHIAEKSPPPPRRSPASITREIALIDRARAAIADGDPQRALATLDEYDSEHRNGALSLEAKVLRIEALASAGDDVHAASHARRFLEQHPQTAYDARVRAHLTNP